MKEYGIDYFQKYVSLYKNDKHTKHRMEKVISLISDLSVDGRILDLGCGVGIFSRELLNNGRHTFSTDISYEALSIAKEKFGIQNITCSNALKIPFKDESFDYILLIEVIEHIEGTSKLIFEIDRILKSEGFLIITTSPITTYVFFPIIQKIREISLFHKLVDYSRNAKEKHIALQNPKKLIKLLGEFGFEVINVKYWNAFHINFILSRVKIKVLRNLWKKSLLLDKIISNAYMCNDAIIVAKKTSRVDSHL